MGTISKTKYVQIEKSLVKLTYESSITFVTRILELAIHIISFIIIVRVLGPERQGIYYLTLLLPTLLLTFCNMGIASSSVYHLGKKNYKASDIIGNNILATLILGVIGILIGFVIIVFFSSSLFKGVPKPYLFFALFLYPLLLFFTLLDKILLGLIKIKEYNFYYIIQKLFFLILVLLFLILFRLGITACIWANILSYSITVILLLLFIKSVISQFKLKFNKRYLKDAFNFSLKVYIGNIIVFLHYRIDVLIINIFINPIAVGFYSVAIALVEKIWLISESAGTILFTKVASETDPRNLKEFTPFICRNVLIISSLISVILFFLAKPLLILFFSGKYLNSVLSFKILLIGAISMSGWQIIANDLYGRGKPELNIIISLPSLILNIILNIVLIPNIGIIGAAWATSISYTFAFFAIAVVYHKISGNPLSKFLFAEKSDFLVLKTVIISIFLRTIHLKSIKNVISK